MDNGFAYLFEAKVLSDISYSISFDNFRNQLARNIDVMLEVPRQTDGLLKKRDPEKSLFCLLTPASFKKQPHSRLYGWHMNEYCAEPDALDRDLVHRQQEDWRAISNRLGWLTFEDIEETRPGACPWLSA